MDEPFNAWKARIAGEPTYMCALNNKTYSTLHAFIGKALCSYVKKSSAQIAMVETGTGSYTTEYTLPDGRTMIVSLGQNFTLRGCYLDMTGRAIPLDPLGSKSDEMDTSAIFLAFLPALAGIDAQAKDDLASLTNYYEATGEWEESLFYRLCDSMYCHISKGKLDARIPQGNIPPLQVGQISSGALNGTIICGSPRIITGASAQARSKSKTYTMKEAKGEFAAFASTKSWTPQEMELIPVFADDFPVPREAMKIASRFVKTQNDKRPMTNFFWRGITSYGKSTGVEVIAAMLNMPLLRVTCHSTMETMNFLSEFVPDSGANPVADGSLPSFNEMAFDPAGAYEQLTGIEDEDATSEMCLEAYREAVRAQNSSSAPRFKHVESSFVRALSKGYMLEVQEISRIKDSGVLVGLNEYDRPGAVIPLVDGTFTRRSPNALVVYTDNVGLVSCRPVDPSVLRRMAFVIDSYDLPKEQVIERVIYNTKFPDKAMLESMYNVWNEVQIFCRDHEIVEGSISVTEIEMWAQAVMADGMENVRENCIDCVVSKATSDIDEQKQIISSVLQVHLNF